MKTLRLTNAFLLGFLICIFGGACNDKECEEVSCGEGKCKDGICHCYPGYSGQNCEIRMNSGCIGNYQLTENCSVSGLNNYTITVNPNVLFADQVRFAGLYGEPNSSAMGTIYEGSGVINILKQSFHVNGWSIETLNGTRTPDCKTITLEYVIRDDNENLIEVCTASLSR